jgi:hypothetical protein
MRKALHIFFFLFSIGVYAQNTVSYLCILRSTAQKDTMCDGKVIPVFGITNSLGAMSKIPAKILYCNEGDSMVLNTKSISQGEHHTIHLHGLDVDTRNDGDPSTSFWLSHMQDTTYSFRAKHAGTYLYHCHAADVVHVQMGMYGMIVVRAAGGAKQVWTGGPSYDKDYKWLMSEVDSSWHFNVPKHDTIADTVHVPKYVPHYFLINGKCGTELNTDDSIKIKGAQGEKILMRLANIGYLSNRVVFPSWLNAQILDSDGRPLPSAIVNDTCYIMPGERFSVMLQASTQATANVAVEYLDMNTGNIVLTNPVAVEINGMIGIKENKTEMNSLQLFPNPVSGILHIGKVNDKEIEVINCLGQSLIKAFDKSEIDVSMLPAGVYFIRVGSAIAKFVKE